MKKLLYVITGLFLFLSTAVRAEPVKVKHPQQNVLVNPNGRYILGQISDFRSDQYLLDTHTGRLWIIVADKEDHRKLQPVPIIQIWGNEAYVPDPIEEVEGLREFTRPKTAEDVMKYLENDGGVRERLFEGQGEKK